ncbi:Gfo/Idh/MocA family protein [Sediminibacter sp. Hel_I_10]|uniref:Gfo/Idh/MocA family protein n=1 Tax=Sediminibacter sp. Hel_I_10 TaxID=1392490 RepID=UPI00047B825D|nr:Gfo/Idh/MocA family oxidoreductase [Sediminibacter sp. Hel_I_10]
MKTHVSWGIIGCGDVAEVKSGPAFQIAENSSLVAVMRRDKAKAENFAKRHKVPFFYDNADEVIQHPEINAIYIATPPSSHLAYALQALKANKDVYLEKPMTLDAHEGQQLLEALKSSKSKVTIAHYRRQLPAFLKVKELIEQRILGDVLFADIQILQPKSSTIIADTEDNWRLKPSISGGGYFHDLAPHQLDLMLHWFGDMRSAFGASTKNGNTTQVSSTVNGIIHFKNGLQFRGIWCFNVSEADQKDQCVIYGTKGHIKFSFYGDHVSLCENGKTETFQFTNPKHVQQPMIQQAVNYFLGTSENPCSVEDGLKVMRIMDEFTQ